MREKKLFITWVLFATPLWRLRWQNLERLGLALEKSLSVAGGQRKVRGAESKIPFDRAAFADLLIEAKTKMYIASHLGIKSSMADITRCKRIMMEV